MLVVPRISPSTDTAKPPSEQQNTKIKMLVVPRISPGTATTKPPSKQQNN